MLTYTDLMNLHGLRPKWTYKSLIDRELEGMRVWFLRVFVVFFLNFVMF